MIENILKAVGARHLILINGFQLNLSFYDTLNIYTIKKR